MQAVLQLRSGRRSARLQRMIRSQVRRAFHGYCRKRTCKKTVMSGRIKAGFVILLNFRRRLIAFVAFRRCRFWCEIGAVRHSSLAGQRIHHASRTVGSNPSLSAMSHCFQIILLILTRGLAPQMRAISFVSLSSRHEIQRADQSVQLDPMRVVKLDIRASKTDLHGLSLSAYKLVLVLHCFLPALPAC
jgi:hypothetical protein